MLKSFKSCLESLKTSNYFGFGNFRVTFISRFFHFRIIIEFLNLRASIRVVGNFRGFKIGTRRISCKKQIDVLRYRIVVHVVRQLKLELYLSFCYHKGTLTLFVAHTDSHWTTSESFIRYSITLN